MSEMTLFDAVYYENVDEVYRCIFDNEKLINVPNEVGNHCIHACAHAGNEKIMDILIKAGAQVNAPGRAGNTPLHYAAKQGHYNVVKKLVESGADPTHKNNRGNTPRDLCFLLRRRSSSTELFGEPLPTREDEQVDLTQDGETIIKLLDDWVLKKCSFLDPKSEEATSPDPATASPKAESDTSDERLSSPRSTELELDTGKEILKKIKPLIAEQKSLIAEPKPLIAETIATDSNNNQSPRANDLLFLQKGPNVRHEAPPVEKLQVSTAPSEEPAVQKEVEQEQADELTQEPSDKEEEARTSGYYIEMDGKKVFVPDAKEDEYDFGSDDEDCSEASDSNEEADQTNSTNETAPAPEEETKIFHVSLTPGEVGLGMQLTEGGSLTKVSALHPLGPAAAQNVCVGDHLTSVNTINVEGMTVNEVKSLLQKETELESEIDLTFIRN
uniref:PDZ domain-containing protein n=1 Tax=Mucochytrium quahogii TaxID=96639 RepID=A0A7S2WI08_9STRA|mmetsp:Transcript_23627/g.37709  ORF Transcript_23627/g.37709 Transcript_23627/m.37709 type:complete len:442 (+) Transcript_23627:101-1426(+)